MKKYLILCTFLSLFLSVQANASYFAWPTDKVNDGILFTAVNVTDNNNNAPQVQIGSAGLYDIFFYNDELSNGGVFEFHSMGFCVGPFLAAREGFADLEAITTSGLKAAAWLMDSQLFSADTAEKQTGLQLAIWAALDYNDTSLDLSINALASSSKDIYGKSSYDYYEDYYDDYLGIKGDTNLLDQIANGYVIVDFQNDERQDMIIKKPIPEPGTMLLFGLGLLSLSAFGRRKKLTQP